MPAKNLVCFGLRTFKVCLLQYGGVACCLFKCCALGVFPDSSLFQNEQCRLLPVWARLSVLCKLKSLDSRFVRNDDACFLECLCCPFPRHVLSFLEGGMRAFCDGEYKIITKMK